MWLVKKLKLHFSLMKMKPEVNLKNNIWKLWSTHGTRLLVVNSHWEQVRERFTIRHMSLKETPDSKRFRLHLFTLKYVSVCHFEKTWYCSFNVARLIAVYFQQVTLKTFFFIFPSASFLENHKLLSCDASYCCELFSWLGFSVIVGWLPS